MRPVTTLPWPLVGDGPGNHQVPSDLHGVNEHRSQTGTDTLQPAN